MHRFQDELSVIVSESRRMDNDFEFDAGSMAKEARGVREGFEIGRRVVVRPAGGVLTAEAASGNRLGFSGRIARKRDAHNGFTLGGCGFLSI